MKAVSQYIPEKKPEQVFWRPADILLVTHAAVSEKTTHELF